MRTVPWNLVIRSQTRTTWPSDIPSINRHLHLNLYSHSFTDESSLHTSIDDFSFICLIYFPLIRCRSHSIRSRWNQSGKYEKLDFVLLSNIVQQSYTVLCHIHRQMIFLRLVTLSTHNQQTMLNWIHSTEIGMSLILNRAIQYQNVPIPHFSGRDSPVLYCRFIVLALWELLCRSIACTCWWKLFYMSLSWCYTSTANKDSNGLQYTSKKYNNTDAVKQSCSLITTLQGSLIEDCVASLCSPCLLMQMKKELDHHNVPDPFASRETRSHSEGESLSMSNHETFRSILESSSGGF